MRKILSPPGRIMPALCACAVLLAGCPGGVAKHYSAGDALHVIAEGGLVLREKPDAASKALATVPGGSTVTIAETSFFQKSHREGAVRGHWVAVSSGARRGFLFDGFLSRYPAFRPGASSRSEYFARIFGAPTVERTEKDGVTVTERRFSNGVRIVETGGGIDCVEKVEYFIPAVRIDTAFYLFRNLLVGLDRVREFPTRSYAITLSETQEETLELNIHVKGNGDDVAALDFLQDGIAYTCGIYREGDGVRAEECRND